MINDQKMVKNILFKLKKITVGFYFIATLLIVSINSTAEPYPDVSKLVDHHYVENAGVKIHYVTMGEGPLVLFVHGFPDFWYTWRYQMMTLAKTHKVAAIDLRGYNLSDGPPGVENYTYDFLIKDLAAVIRDNGEKAVYVVAHDWGAAISWRLAAHHPELVKKLVILNTSHPQAGDDKPFIPIEQRQPTYADYFASEEFDKKFTENWFSGLIKDPDTKEIYKEAFRKSNKDAMINYYRANVGLLENLKDKTFLKRQKKAIPNIKMPVLIIHGKKDTYALTAAHNNTWNFIDNEVSIEILPHAGHFTHRDESVKVTELIQQFLAR